MAKKNTYYYYSKEPRLWICLNTFLIIPQMRPFMNLSPSVLVLPCFILSDLKEHRVIIQLSDTQSHTALWPYHLWHPDLWGWEMLSTPVVGWQLSQNGNTNSNMARSTTLGFPCLTASYPQSCTRSQLHSWSSPMCQLARVCGLQNSKDILTAHYCVSESFNDSDDLISKSTHENKSNLLYGCRYYKWSQMSYQTCFL